MAAVNPARPSHEVPVQMHIEFYVDELKQAEAQLQALGATTSEQQVLRDPAMLAPSLNITHILGGSLRKRSTDLPSTSDDFDYTARPNRPAQSCIRGHQRRLQHFGERHVKAVPGPQSTREFPDPID